MAAGNSLCSRVEKRQPFFRFVFFPMRAWAGAGLAIGGILPVNTCNEMGKGVCLFGLSGEAREAPPIGAFSSLREKDWLWQKPTVQPGCLFGLCDLFMWKAPKSPNKEAKSSMATWLASCSSVGKEKDLIVFSYFLVRYFLQIPGA
jgi:hypothetical protein